MSVDLINFNTLFIDIKPGNEINLTINITKEIQLKINLLNYEIKKINALINEIKKILTNYSKCCFFSIFFLIQQSDNTKFLDVSTENEDVILLSKISLFELKKQIV